MWVGVLVCFPFFLWQQATNMRSFAFLVLAVAVVGLAASTKQAALRGKVGACTCGPFTKQGVSTWAKLSDVNKKSTCLRSAKKKAWRWLPEKGTLHRFRSCLGGEVEARCNLHLAFVWGNRYFGENLVIR